MPPDRIGIAARARGNSACRACCRGCGIWRPRRTHSPAVRPAGRCPDIACAAGSTPCRSEEHTSELQSLMRISYAVFCLKKKNIEHYIQKTHLCHRHTPEEKTKRNKQ